MHVCTAISISFTRPAKALTSLGVIFTFEMKTDISDQILSQLIGGTARLADSQRSERGAWQLALGLASIAFMHIMGIICLHEPGLQSFSLLDVLRACVERPHVYVISLCLSVTVSLRYRPDMWPSHGAALRAVSTDNTNSRHASGTSSVTLFRILTKYCIVHCPCNARPRRLSHIQDPPPTCRSGGVTSQVDAMRPVMVS